MTNIFTYGSLMFPEVWELLVRGRYPSRVAVLEGFQRKSVKNAQYPALIKHDGTTRVTGVMYLGVSKVDLKRIDLFEGEQYRRISVRVRSEETHLEADVYLWRRRFNMLLADRDWDEDSFRRRGLKQFLAHYKGFEAKG